MAMPGGIIEGLLKEDTDNYIIVDWLSITNNVSQPLFLKPFPPSFIIDILTGKKKVIFGLNLDNLIELFNRIGIKTKWLSTKETAKRRSLGSKSGMIEINNRAISMRFPDREEEVMLGGGVISKIFFDNILPSNMAISLMSYD
jgi:hypothetical protein